MPILPNLISGDSSLFLLELRLFWAVAGLYLFTSILYLIYILTASMAVAKSARVLLCITAVLHGGLLFFSSFESGSLPVGTPYEIVSVFGFFVAATYSISTLFTPRFHLGGIFISATALITTIYTQLCLNPATEALSIMRQTWCFKLQVLLTFIAFALFSVALFNEFGAYIALRIERKGSARRWDLTKIRIESLSQRARNQTLLAYPLLTLALFIGALWSNDTHGAYMLHNSLHAYSILIWCIYTASAHTRLMPGRVVYTPLLNSAGFIAILFTLLSLGLQVDFLEVATLPGITGE